MNTNVSFRHMDSSPALRDYATGKLERVVDKYVHGRVEASVVLSVEKFRHIANFTVQIKNLTVKGDYSSEDMYSSVDLALDKIEYHLRVNNKKWKKISVPAAVLINPNPRSVSFLIVPFSTLLLSFVSVGTLKVPLKF